MEFRMSALCNDQLQSYLTEEEVSGQTRSRFMASLSHDKPHIKNKTDLINLLVSEQLFAATTMYSK